MTGAAPIACNLDALTPPERERRSLLAARVRGGVLDAGETADGFRLRLPADPSLLGEVVELIALERRCCPFLELALSFAPGDGPVHLELRGDEAVKQFLAASGLLGWGR